MTNMLRMRFGRVAAAALIGGLVAAAGCDVQGLVGPRGNQVASFGGPASSSTSSSLIGTWRFTLVFFDEFGFANSTETTWQFSGDGTAVRTIITRNLTLGASDVVLTTARWRVDGSRVVIEFISPTTGTIELDFTIQGNQLILAGQTFSRVGG